MSRYRLSPAEQLRRQLNRISRHQNDAAAQVQRKWKSMQENIAPFIQEDSGSNHTAAQRNSPCFASRVPTGRLPEDLTGVIAAGGHDIMVSRNSDEKELRAGDMSAIGNVWSLAYQSRSKDEPKSNGDELPKDIRSRINAVELADDLLDEEARLTEALESEIQMFFQKSGVKSEKEISDQRPKFRPLRRIHKQGIGETARCRQTSEISRCPPRQLAKSMDSDSEIGELEEDANMLEAQLAWWRWHKETLLRLSKHDDAESVSSRKSFAAEARAQVEMAQDEAKIHTAMTPAQVQPSVLPNGELSATRVLLSQVDTDSSAFVMANAFLQASNQPMETAGSVQHKCPENGTSVHIFDEKSAVSCDDLPETMVQHRASATRTIAQDIEEKVIVFEREVELLCAHEAYEGVQVKCDSELEGRSDWLKLSQEGMPHHTSASSKQHDESDGEVLHGAALSHAKVQSQAIIQAMDHPMTDPSTRQGPAAPSPKSHASSLAAATISFAREWAGELANVDGARGQPTAMQGQTQQHRQNCEISVIPPAPKLEIRSFDDLFNL
jgi:hypothetical protein